jgi:hypothetical protein
MSFVCEVEEYNVVPVVVGVVKLEFSPAGADPFLGAEGELDKMVVDDVVAVVMVVIVVVRESLLLLLLLAPSPAKPDPEPDRPALVVTEAVEESCRTNVEITTTDLTKSLTPMPNRRRRMLDSSKLVPAPCC